MWNYPKTGQPNWDCPEAIDFDGLIATLTHVKELGYFPEDFNSLEDKNPVGSKEFSTPIPQQDLDRMRDMILGSSNRHLDITRTKFVILDGFILYVNALLRETIDIKFFVTAPYQVLKERRESRKGYATLEGYWEDPPGYFDDVVWPNYLIYNGPLVKLADALEAGQDSGMYCSNASSRTDPMTAKIDVVSSGNISIHAMVHAVSELNRNMDMDMDVDEDNVVLHPMQTDKQFTPTPNYTDYKESFASTNTALVIDNVVFDNQIAKFRDRKNNMSVTYVGNDVYSDVVARANIKSGFENSVMCKPEIMENVLDYIFIKLGIDADKINHPIVMTEPVCVPPYNRGFMSELLFESYQVPSVTYGIDSLFSLYANGPERSKDGIVVSAGHQYSHVIPISNGKVHLEHAKRISYGGEPASEYLLKLMQMKYPTFPVKMTTTQSETLLINHSYVAHDYLQELISYEDPEIFKTKDRVIQFPFVAPVIEEKSEEEQARLAAKRKEQGRRLQEQAAKARLEKLMQREQDLEQYMALKNSKSTLKKAEWTEQLKAMGFKDEAGLELAIKTTDAAIKRARNKELGIEEEEKEPPTFPLLDIPDEELSEADRKEKKKQRLLKASHDARMRAKAAKVEEAAYQEELARQDAERREKDPEKWLADIHAKRKELVDKIKAKKQLREQLSDRRSHASQLRMKSIAALASDAPPPKRRRKGQDEDTFGQDDEDWMVYREISRDDDSEDEEEATQLSEYEQQLLNYDPNFLHEHTMNAYTPKNSFLHFYTNGLGPYDPSAGLSLDQTYQLHLNVERIRVPEVLFQPGIVGLDQMGLVETIQDVLKRFDAQARQRLVQNILVTGGMAQIPGLIDRLDHSMRAILPFSPGKKLYEVRRAQDCLLDAWRGAAMISRDSERMHKISVTKREYEEYGGAYLKEHGLGNVRHN
ncbi:Nuclear actin-protein involved in chromatin remodeling [Mortierella polycephala]|uniref:Nuclear actin-protein involved in chromatin remodeling n=1 Tax=Mortierella polycephala TaxID=41804 RepID=A0A9P6QB58_9FUNG|nr:Nuclear actin-protein involved in chromatin remodeling [Mortierella polycephala]